MVRASSEGFGILTLLSDFGRPGMKASVGMDASAAIGIVRRQGISKLRHIEVDVLWLPEQQARRLLSGLHNPSDMGTKHIAVALMDQYLTRLNLEVVAGRAAIAQQLHAADISQIATEDIERGRGDRRSLPEPARSQAIEKGVDSWSSARGGGRWLREHRTTRRALFTPYKVAGGPDRETRMMRYRVTTGACSCNGERFKITDDWMKPSNTHRLLKSSWVGTTEFREILEYLEEQFVKSRRERQDLWGSLVIDNRSSSAARSQFSPDPTSTATSTFSS